MKRKLCFHLITLAVMARVPTAFGVGLVDLGPAGPVSFDSHTGNDKPPYIADVSKDGTLAGGTDSRTNAFIWTPSNGRVNIGTNIWLVGVDWLIVSGVSTNVLAVGNSNNGNYPVYWQGNANGTGGSWSNFPPMDGNAGSGGYWQATSLGAQADGTGTNWWVAGFRNLTGGTLATSEAIMRYQNSTASATSIGMNSTHNRSFFYAASDQGTFAGVAQYGGSGPDNGSRNGVKWYYNIESNHNSDPCGPPEAGNGTQLSTSYTCIADAISGDGSTLGGVDKNGAIWPALFWAKHLYVYELPILTYMRSGTNYTTDWMDVRSMNHDGSIMGGFYCTDSPADNLSLVEAFLFYLSGYNDGDPYSVTGTLLRVCDLLASWGIKTNGWTFREVTGLSDNGNTLVGYGVTNGVTHAWLAQLPAIYITNITFDGVGNALIDFKSSNSADDTTSFAVQQSATLVNTNTPFADNPAAAFAGSAGSFEATVPLPLSGNRQFYRIRHLPQRPLGIDVYHGDGTINWAGVQVSGITFAWAKATEGTFYTDPSFTNNEVNAKAVGVYIGAYHFAHPESNAPSADALYFWTNAVNYIKADGKSLMPMLDFEVLGSTGASSMSDWINKWCQAVVNYASAAGITVKPVVYTSSSIASSYLDSSVTQWTPWIAEWPGSPNPQTGAPSSTTPWPTWVVWQYANSGPNPGDADVFNGSLSDLVTTLVIGGSH